MCSVADVLSLQMDQRIQAQTQGRKSMRDSYRALPAWSAKNQRVLQVCDPPRIVHESTEVDIDHIMDRSMRPLSLYIDKLGWIRITAERSGYEHLPGVDAIPQMYSVTIFQSLGESVRSPWLRSIRNRTPWRRDGVGSRLGCGFYRLLPHARCREYLVVDVIDASSGHLGVVLAMSGIGIPLVLTEC
jgi:hypothetical protein